MPPFINNIISKRHKSIFSASLVLAVAFGASAILGVLRNRFLYAQFFNCCLPQLDAYNAAFRIPDLIFKLLVTGALSASFIPVFSTQLKKHPGSAYQFASVIINLLLAGFIIVGLLAFIYINPLSHLITRGFSDPQFELMASLSRILILGQLFFLVSNFITAILQVNQIFVIPALSPIFYNLAVILSIILLAPHWGFAGVAWGTVAGAVIHFLIQIPSLVKTGFKYLPFTFKVTTPVREVFKLMIPRTLSLGLNEIESTVTLFFASSLISGTISIFNLALQIIFLPSRIISTTVGQAALPTLSRKVASHKLIEFRRIVSRTIYQSLFLIIPITAILLVNRLAIVRLLFGSRNFPWSATLTTAKTLAFLLPVIPCQTVIQIIARAFYALHDTATPFRIAAIALITNVVAAWYFVTFTSLSVLGLALSVSLGNVTQALLLAILFYGRFPGIHPLSTVKRLWQFTFSSILAAAGSWVTLRLLDLLFAGTTKTWMVAVGLIVSSFAGLIIFLVLSKYFCVEELSNYLNLLKRIKTKFQK